VGCGHDEGHEGALSAAGAIVARPHYLSAYRIFTGFSILRNRNEGPWVREVEAGAAIRKGESMGDVLDLFGRRTEAIESPTDAFVLGVCTYGFVPPEAYIAEPAPSSTGKGHPRETLLRASGARPWDNDWVRAAPDAPSFRVI
jgi:hypothetical protein